MTALTENTGGRLIPRYHGPAIVHDIQWLDDGDGATIAVCAPCDIQYRLQPGHTEADRARLAAQHQGQEDT